MAHVVSANRSSSGSAGVPARRGRRPAGHIGTPSSLFLVALCFLLAAPANPAFGAAATNAAPAPSELLQFLDGAVLHGALQGVDAARGLRWEHPDAKTPFDLMPAHVDFVRFTQAKSWPWRPRAIFGSPTATICSGRLFPWKAGRWNSTPGLAGR